MKRFVILILETVLPIVMTAVFIFLIWSLFNDPVKSLAQKLELSGVITAIYISFITLVLGLQQRRVDRRPYLGLKDNEFSTNPVINIGLPLTNFSQYPGRIIRQVKKWHLDDQEMQDPPSLTKETVVMPSERVMVYRILLTPEQTQKVIGGYKRLKVEYLVEYEDLNQTGRWQFEIEYQYDGGALGIVRSVAI